MIMLQAALFLNHRTAVAFLPVIYMKQDLTKITVIECKKTD